MESPRYDRSLGFARHDTIRRSSSYGGEAVGRLLDECLEDGAVAVRSRVSNPSVY